MGRGGDATQRRSGARTDRSRPGRVRVGVRCRGQERARTEGGRVLPDVAECVVGCGVAVTTRAEPRSGEAGRVPPPPEVPVRYRSAAARHPRSSRRGPIPDPEGVVLEAVSAVLTPRRPGSGPSHCNHDAFSNETGARSRRRSGTASRTARTPSSPGSRRPRTRRCGRSSRGSAKELRQGITMGNHGRDSQQGVTAGTRGKESRQGITAGNHDGAGGYSRRITCPARAPVSCPSSTATSPFTSTQGIPSGAPSGSRMVAWSTTRS